MTVAHDPRTVRAVFEEASEIADPAELATFLERACGADALLRAGVEVLLRAHQQAGGFLADLDPAPCPALSVPSETTPEYIGSYKLLQKLGEGGCGIVYLAEQRVPVRRHVALKIIKLGMDTRNVVARFEAERQALAMMDHPNIAKILDAGVTEARHQRTGMVAPASDRPSGRPYFVMELVRGIRITEYCDQNNLPTRARLELFIKICQAIQHAHQKGIIHRDIKPSNILVTLEDGMAAPKVIDFGIAKAMEQRLTNETMFTSIEQFIGTPAYMSPEQAEMSAAGIDTRSDIYSLGVLLYELLTGTTPFDTKQLLAAGVDELRRTIRECEPVRPSTRLSQTQSARRIPGPEHSAFRTPHSAIESDLDWIVMKCLEKDRTRRYETANGLAMDLRRHLNHEPVVARPPTAAYRFQKSWRRNRLVCSTGVTVALSLLGALVVSHRQMAETRTARNDERAQRLLAEDEKAEAKRLLYGATMSLIREGWEENDIARVRQLLDETRDSPSRGFEWEYWQHQSDLSLRTLRGPAAEVTAARFSPDGRWILTGSAAHSALLWDVLSGRQLRIFDCPGRGVFSADFSPDAQWVLISGGVDGEARIFETATGQKVRQLNPSDASIWSSAFSPDGTRIVTGCENGLIKVWDAATGRELLNLVGHTDFVWRVAYSPNGRWIGSGSRDATAKVWDAATGQEVVTFKGHTDRIWGLAFSPDSQRVITTSDDRTAKIWDAATGREVLTLRGHTLPVGCAAFSLDGQQVVTGSADTTIKVWEAASGRELFTLKGHVSWLEAVAFSPDGKAIVSGSQDGTAKIWKAAEDHLFLKLDLREAFLRNVAFSPEGKRILTAGDAQPLRVWDVASGRELLALPALTNSMAVFLPDGRRILAAAGHWPAALVCDSGNGQILLKLQGHQAGFRSIAASADGRRILTGGFSDGTARLWDAENGRELNSLKGPETLIFAGALSTNGGWAAVANGAQTAAVWNTDSGHEAFKLVGHGARIWALTFSPDGRRIASGSVDGTARIWNARTGQELAVLSGHRDRVVCLAFSPDGARLVTGSADRTAKLWDASTGLVGNHPQRDLLTLKGHNDVINAVAFSPDGQSIATASGDQTVRLWSAPRDPVSPSQVDFGQDARVLEDGRRWRMHYFAPN